MYLQPIIGLVISLLSIAVLGKPSQYQNGGVDIFTANLEKLFNSTSLKINLHQSPNTEVISPTRKCKKNQSTDQNLLSKITPRTNNNIDENDDNVDENNCEYAEILIPKCGIRNPNGIGARILNGEESEIFEFPWVVAILKVQKTSAVMKHLFLCGGSLIHPSVILTIAHCVQKHKNNPEIIKLRAGEWDFSNTEEMIPAQDRMAKEIIIHEQFKKGSLVNDIALIILTDPFELHRNINPICLPNQDSNFDNIMCTTVGWGKNQMSRAGKYSKILNKIDLPIVPKDECQDSLRTELGAQYNLNPSFLCAGGQAGKDTCVGDGGSPLNCPIFGKKNQYFQIGSVSWGIGCGNSIPGVYSNLMHLRQWIDNQMTNQGFSTDYYTNI